MTAPLLGDALGPRGRRRVLVASVVSLVVLALALFVAVRRLADAEQLTAVKWRPFTQWAILRFLLLGLVATLKVAALSISIALVAGSALALGRLARNRPVRWVAGVWVELFRGVPLLLLIFFSARGLPKLGVHLPVFWYLVLGLALYNSAVLAEIFRAGILSLDRGQTEAAQVIGLRYWPTMLLVVLPQAVRRMAPAIVSQVVTLLKDTSLGFVLPYEEFLRRGQLVGEVPGKPLLQSLLAVAVVYVAVNLVLSRTAQRLEVRQRRRYRAAGIAVAGVEDLAVITARGERGA